MELVDLIATPTAFVGSVGAGKTFAAKGATEKLLAANARVLIIDPTGAWWGLRTGADGDPAKGFPVTIFGGDHADIPVTPESGAMVAHAIARRAVQAIIDTSEMTSGEKLTFLTPFLETLYAQNRAPLYLVVDEADEICPQNPMPDQRRLSGIFDKIVRRGRIKGFRPLMITQRPAVLHKNVLSQVGTLVAMKLGSPQDRKAIEEWVKGNADNEQARDVVATLASLPRGEGWVWSPANGVLERRTFPKIRTFDSSRSPEIDDVIVEPALTAVDVAELADAMFISAPSEEVQKLNTPSPAQLKAAEDRVRAAEDRGYQRGLEDGIERGKVSGLALGLTRARNALDALRIPDIVAEDQRDIEPVPLTGEAYKAAQLTENRAASERVAALAGSRSNPIITGSKPSAVVPLDGFTGSQSKVLGAIAAWRALGHAQPTREMVAALAGYSPSSGTFRNILGSLRTAGAVNYPDDGRVGLMAVVDAPRLSTAKGNLLNSLSGPQRRVIAELEHGDLSREDLARRTGYAASSGTFRNIVGSLRTLGLVEYPTDGRVVVSAWLSDLLPLTVKELQP